MTGTIIPQILLTVLIAAIATFAGRYQSPKVMLCGFCAITLVLWCLLDGLLPSAVSFPVVEPPLLVTTLGLILYCDYRFQSTTAYGAIAFFLGIGLLTAEIAQQWYHLSFVEVLKEAVQSGLPMALGGVAALVTWQALKKTEVDLGVDKLKLLSIFAVALIFGLSLDSIAYLAGSGQINLLDTTVWLPQLGYKLGQKVLLGCGIVAPIFVLVGPTPKDTAT